ncbi:MAG TPA: hypothetical protein VEB39_05040, partial [Sphingomicrobium sp.]|nr:hypothetical protein [Sphingomicrobium sp.]
MRDLSQAGGRGLIGYVVRLSGFAPIAPAIQQLLRSPAGSDNKRDRAQAPPRNGWHRRANQRTLEPAIAPRQLTADDGAQYFS